MIGEKPYRIDDLTDGSEGSYTVNAMKLTINGQEREVEADRVDTLLAALGMADQAVAVELNKDVVPKRYHVTTALKEGDVVELVTLVGGG